MALDMLRMHAIRCKADVVSASFWKEYVGHSVRPQTEGQTFRVFHGKEILAGYAAEKITDRLCDKLMELIENDS